MTVLAASNCSSSCEGSYIGLVSEVTYFSDRVGAVRNTHTNPWSFPRLNFTQRWLNPALKPASSRSPTTTQIVPCCPSAYTHLPLHRNDGDFVER